MSAAHLPLRLLCLQCALPVGQEQQPVRSAGGGAPVLVSRQGLAAAGCRGIRQRGLLQGFDWLPRTGGPPGRHPQAVGHSEGHAGGLLKGEGQEAGVAGFADFCRQHQGGAAWAEVDGTQGPASTQQMLESEGRQCETQHALHWPGLTLAWHRHIAEGRQAAHMHPKRQQVDMPEELRTANDMHGELRSGGGRAQGPHLRVLSATEGPVGDSSWFVGGAGFEYSHMCSLCPEATASTSPLSLNAREAMGRPAGMALQHRHDLQKVCSGLLLRCCSTQRITSWKVSGGQTTSMGQSALRRTKVMVVDALPGADIPQPDLVVK